MKIVGITLVLNRTDKVHKKILEYSLAWLMFYVVLQIRNRVMIFFGVIHDGVMSFSVKFATGS